MNTQIEKVSTEIEPLLELRGFAYDVLRRVFWEEPSRELIKQLKGGILTQFPFQVDETLIREGIELVVGYLKDYKPEVDFDRLHWDYTRMFIGPYKLPAPMWESSYVNEEKLLFQEETLRVRRAYLKYDFLAKQDGREAEDHLGLELDFMYQLNLLTKELVTTGEISKAHDVLLDQFSFLKDHLLVWTPYFRENVLEHGETNFYKGMVKILTGFLIIDEECIDELLTETKVQMID